MKKVLLKPRNVSLIISILVALFFFMITSWPVGRRWELAAYDFRLNLLGRLDKFDERIIIIGIDSDTVEKLGPLPYPRSVYADLVNKLSEFKPAVIAFDMEFDAKDRFFPENDEDFAKAIKDSGKVILAHSFVVKDSSLSSFGPKKKEFKLIEPIEILKKSCALTGYVKIDPDIDGIIREVTLAMEISDGWKPQFDLAIISLLEGVKPEDIKVEDNRIIVGKRTIPVNKKHQIYINYQTENLSSGSAFRYTLKPVSLYKVLEPGFSLPVENSIFLIGSYHDEAGDFHKTPNRNEFGVKIHGNILNTILKESYIYEAPPWVNLLVVLFMSVILSLFLHRFTARMGALISLALLFIFVFLNFLLFYNGIWIDLYYPLVTIFICFAMIESYRFLRTYRLFQQFLPAEYVAQMLKDAEAQKLGGEEVEATVLFSDIRGYTNLSENLNPTQVMDLLNEYHTKMSVLFKKYNGRVFDYQGDAQMVVFGAVKKDDNHALNALRCGLDMQKALQELVEKWAVDKKNTFEVGIGICTGQVALGYVGSETHKQLAAIGDTTNTAARLQGLSKQLDSPVTIVHKTYEYVKGIQDDFICEELEPVSVKGKKEPLKVYRVKKREI